MLILLCLRTSKICTSALYLLYRTAAITPMPFHASASSRPRTLSTARYHATALSRLRALSTARYHATTLSRPRTLSTARYHASASSRLRSIKPLSYITHPLRARIGAYIGAKLRKNINKEKHHREKFPDGVILSMSGLIVATSGRGTPRALCATRQVWQRSAASRSRRPPSPSYSQ